MSSAPSPLHTVLNRILRHLLLVLGGLFGARIAFLRARLDALPAGHRRRARIAAEMARLARLTALLAEGDLLEDAAFRGKAAEVARVRNDAGRRAMVRRRIHPTRYGLLRAARPAPDAAWHRLDGRCTASLHVA